MLYHEFGLRPRSAMRPESLLGLLDHLICGGEHRLRNSRIECPCDLEIARHFEFRWQADWQVGRSSPRKTRPTYTLVDWHCVYLQG